MAIKQTRRSISLSKAVHNAVAQAADKAGVSRSQWLTDLIRAALPDLPKTYHAGQLRPEQKRADIVRRFYGDAIADALGEP